MSDGLLTKGRGDLSFLDGMLGNKDFNGWGVPALQGILGGVSAFTGLQNLGLAKDQFNFTKNFANTNLANQAQTTNTLMRDKATARYIDAGGANNPNNPYAAPDAYMAQNQVKGKIG